MRTHTCTAGSSLTLSKSISSRLMKAFIFSGPCPPFRAPRLKHCDAHQTGTHVQRTHTTREDRAQRQLSTKKYAGVRNACLFLKYNAAGLKLPRCDILNTLSLTLPVKGILMISCSSASLSSHFVVSNRWSYGLIACSAVCSGEHKKSSQYFAGTFCVEMQVQTTHKSIQMHRQARARTNGRIYTQTQTGTQTYQQRQTHKHTHTSTHNTLDKKSGASRYLHLH